MAAFLNLFFGHPNVDVSAFLGLVVLGAILYISMSSSKPDLPLVNGLKKGEFRSQHARRRFVAHAQNLIRAGFAKVGNYRVQ